MSPTPSETDIPGRPMSVVGGTPTLEPDFYTEKEVDEAQRLASVLRLEPRPPARKESKKKRREKLWAKVEHLTKGGGI